jgi:hypothetical protein
VFAFRFETRKEVDAFHAKALALGVATRAPAGERAPKFHGSYLLDLDGNKLCATRAGG